MEERREGRRKESKIGEHRRWWKKRGAGAQGVGREEGGGREEEKEGPLFQPSAELRNLHRLGLAAGCARRSAPAPPDQWERRGVAFTGVESRRALSLCSNRGPLSEDLSLLLRAATSPAHSRSPLDPCSGSGTRLLVPAVSSRRPWPRRSTRRRVARRTT